MSAPKFKAGDRVKWRRVDGQSSIGDVVAMKVDAAYGYQYKLSDGSGPWWHESHLSLDVPEPKKYATDLEAQLGAEVIKQHRAITDLSNRLSEEINKNLRFHDHLNDVQTECVRRGDLLNAVPLPAVEAIAHLSNRLTEEIGARHRERIAKEAALAAESLALASLRKIAETLGDKSNLTDQGLREKIPALAAWKMKELAASYTELNRASELLIYETRSFMKERQLKESAQADVKRIAESKVLMHDKLMSAANEVYIERVAKEAAQKELADVRKDLADLRIISRRLAL